VPDIQQDRGEGYVRYTGHERDGVNGIDYMFKRYYSQHLARFLSTDPVGGKVGSSQSWNKYVYVNNDPINAIDPDGRDVHYENKKDKKFYTKAAAKNRLVAATLNYFAPGTGRDLYIKRTSDAGVTTGGEPRKAYTEIGKPVQADATDPAVEARMLAAKKKAGGGKAGDDAAIDAQLEVKDATIVLGPMANKHTKLHELGHVHHAITNYVDSLQAVAIADGLTGEAYRTSKAERTANDFADAAKEDDPPPAGE